MTPDELEMEARIRAERKALHARLEQIRGQYRAQVERRVTRSLEDCALLSDKEALLRGFLAVAEEEYQAAHKRFSAASLLTDDLGIYKEAMDDFFRAKDRLVVLDRAISQLSAKSVPAKAK